jgi:hypothetical protein
MTDNCHSLQALCAHTVTGSSLVDCTGYGLSKVHRTLPLWFAGTPRTCSERQLITGHTNGSVIMWDTSDDTLRPVLLVGPAKGGPKRAVRSVVVLEELGILAVGHANGKVRCYDMISASTML